MCWCQEAGKNKSRKLCGNREVLGKMRSRGKNRRQSSNPRLRVTTRAKGAQELVSQRSAPESKQQQGSTARSKEMKQLHVLKVSLDYPDAALPLLGDETSLPC